MLYSLLHYACSHCVYHKLLLLHHISNTDQTHTTLMTLTIVCCPTDCAVCAKGYSKSIGYQCSKCKTGTKAAIYSALAILLATCLLAIWYLVIQLLGLSDGQDAISTIAAFDCMKKLASLPWDKLRIPVVAFQIVTQFISITGLPLPNIYRRFLSWTDVFNLNLGWLLSLGCLTHINFYQKVLITTLGPFAASAVLMCTHTAVRYKNQVQAVTEYT